jgi:hypothetical protein
MIQMQTKYKVIIAVVALAVSFAAGRFLAPIKTITVVKTVTVDNKTNQEAVNEAQHTKTTTTETDKPDGTKTITSVTTNDTNTQTNDKSTDSSTTNTTSSKTVERSTARLTISALAGIPISFGSSVTPIYGAQVQKDIIGPINLGVWYLSNNTGGLSVGVSF